MFFDLPLNLVFVWFIFLGGGVGLKLTRWGPHRNFQGSLKKYYCLILWTWLKFIFTHVLAERFWDYAKWVLIVNKKQGRENWRQQKPTLGYTDTNLIPFFFLFSHLVCRFVYWCYSDGLQEVNSSSCCVRPDLHVVRWILSEAYSIMAGVVSIYCLHYIFIRCCSQRRVCYLPGI